jgi:hypothetical protein
VGPRWSLAAMAHRAASRAQISGMTTGRGASPDSLANGDQANVQEHRQGGELAVDHGVYQMQQRGRSRQTRSGHRPEVLIVPARGATRLVLWQVAQDLLEVGKVHLQGGCRWWEWLGGATSGAAR